MKPDATGQGGAPMAEAADNGAASSLPTRPGATTLGEYAAAWLARLPEAQRPKRETAVRNWIVPFIGGRELATLSESSVEELRARLLGEGFAVRTYWHAKDVLGQIWRAAYAEGLVKKRPAGRVRNAPDVLAERDRPAAAERTFARPRPSPARPGSLTVMEYAQHWLASRCVPPWMARSTAGVKGKVVRYYLAQSPLAGVPIDALTKSMVAEYQRSLFARGLAYTTVLSVIRGTLGPMMAAAVEDGLIPESPAHGLRWPRQPALKRPSKRSTR